MLSRINPQIISLLLMSLLAHVTLSGGRVASSLFVLEQENSEFIAGLTYGLYGLMPALLSLHIGRLVDRVGSKKIMQLSLFIMVIGLILPALHMSLSSVLLCAALSGLGFGGYILAAHVSVSLMKVERASDRTGLYAWLQMGTSISAVAGPFLVGLIIDRFAFSMAYTCLAGVVFAGFFWSLFVSMPKHMPQKKAKKGESIVQDVIKDRSILRMYLFSMAIYLAWDCFAFMIPVLGHERGYSATSIGIVLSCFAIGTFVVRALQPWLARKSTEWKTLCIGYALAGCVFFLLPLANNLFMLCTLSLVFGFAAGVGHPNILNLILRTVSSDKAGEASGFRLMTGNLTGLLGTSACGAIVAFTGIFPVFFGISAVMYISSWQAARSQKLEPILEERD